MPEHSRKNDVMAAESIHLQNTNHCGATGVQCHEHSALTNLNIERIMSIVLDVSSMEVRMRFPKFLAILVLSAGLFSTRGTPVEADVSSPDAATNSAEVSRFAGFAAVTVQAQVGSSVGVWALAPTGYAVFVGQADVGNTGTATFVAPDLGLGFLIVGKSGDIRDWLE